MRIGTDLCHIPRMRNLLTEDATKKRNPYQAFLTKFLTFPERAYFRRRFGHDTSLHSNPNAAAQFLAG
ncbi:4'-phosphopantetheinyl transferase, partial [Macrophomina phaseolina MS6]